MNSLTHNITLFMQEYFKISDHKYNIIASLSGSQTLLFLNWTCLRWHQGQQPLGVRNQPGPVTKTMGLLAFTLSPLEGPEQPQSWFISLCQEIIFYSTSHISQTYIQIWSSKVLSAQDLYKLSLFFCASGTCQATLSARMLWDLRVLYLHLLRGFPWTGLATIHHKLIFQLFAVVALHINLGNSNNCV